jgi:lysophospholipase L1-like esterase
VRHVFFFGGSAMWGTGARDEMTIPSQVAALLAERGMRDVAITNFGETGYVFTQELIRLELELRRGVRPDVVVVFDGLNDVASAVVDGRAGVPQNESNRVREFRLGRLLASDNDVEALARLGLMAAGRSQLVRRLAALWSTASASRPALDTLAHEVADTYAHTAQLLEALSQRYRFRALYFWQPALHTTRKPLTTFEQALAAAIDADPFQRHLRTVHLAVASEIDSVMARVAPGQFFNQTHVFDHDTGAVFLDEIGHTTEQANAKLSALMLDPLLVQLARGRSARAPRSDP